jgi:hypothetical protein
LGDLHLQCSLVEDQHSIPPGYPDECACLYTGVAQPREIAIGLHFADEIPLQLIRVFETEKATVDQSPYVSERQGALPKETYYLAFDVPQGLINLQAADRAGTLTVPKQHKGCDCAK